MIFSNNLKSTYYESKEKQEIIYEGNKLYFSPNSSYFRINDNIYHLTYQTLLLDNKIYVPVLPMQAILKQSSLNLKITQITKNNIKVKTNLYDIHDFFIEKKSNGIQITIQTSKKFRKPIKNIFFEIEINLFNDKIKVQNISIDNLKFDKKNEEIIQILDNFNSLENKSNNWIYIKKLTNDVLANYFG